MTYKLEIQNICKKFTERPVLENINIQISSGEIITILGGSGTGKSVLMKIIIGLIQQDKGKILYNNQSLSSTKDFQQFYKKISILFQNNALFDSLDIRENILFPFTNYKIPKNISSERMVDESLISVGLDILIKENMISEISGGMQKRVGLARALVTKPEIIFLDEPTSGLDFENSKKIFELITSLSKKENITFIIITHDIFLAPTISDQIIFLNSGQASDVNKEWVNKKFAINCII